ncbi:MAG: class I tRNA ligase family protein, partial [Candidatus Bathyarchaeia archaeon]
MLSPCALTATLLFNPVTPHLSEALHQRVYRKLNPALPETVNLEGWPEPDDSLRDSKVEEQFDTLFKVVSLVYAARQQAKLKRRWPLSKLIVVAPRKLSEALRSVEALFVEMANVKTAEYLTEAPSDLKSEEWVLAVEADTQVFLSKQRDDTLLGEGIMRDLARRVQALRKELGYNPTDVLDSV